MTNFIFKLISIFLFTLSFAFAAKNEAKGIGLVAKNILEPVGLMSNMIQTACFVIGGSFLFASIIKYFEHKRSPLMVPISTVIFLIVTGIILIGLPFLSLVIDTGLPSFLVRR